MKSRSALAGLIVFLGVGLTACPGDSTTPTEQIDLTVAQVNDLIDAWDAISPADAAGLRASGIALATESIDITGDCPNGGTARMVGTYTEPASGTSWTIAVSQAHTSCRSQSPSGVMWTFDGSLQMNESGAYIGDSFSFNTTATIAGTMDVASSAGEGRCTVNVTITGSYDYDTDVFDGEMTGTVCGRSITRSIDEL